MPCKRYSRNISVLILLSWALLVSPLAGCAKKNGPAAKSYKAAIVEVLTGIAGMFLLSSCGSSSSSSSVVTLTGVAQMGRMSGSTVYYCPVSDMADNSECDSPLATTTTDSAGTYTMNIAAQTEPGVIVVSGGEYTDEATGRTVPVAATEKLKVAVADPSVSGRYAATPFSTTAWVRVAEQLKTGLSGMNIEQMKTYDDNSYKYAAEAFGLNISVAELKEIPTDLRVTGATMNPAAFALGQYSQFLKERQIEPENAMAAVNHIADGFKDGALSASELPPAYQVLGSAFANSETGFRAAATAYANNPLTPPAMAAVYSGNMAMFQDPKLTPTNYVGAAYDYYESKKAATAAGETFVDFCAPDSPIPTACPTKAGFIAKDYDRGKNEHNPNITYGVPTGVTGYTGCGGEGCLAFTAPPKAEDYARGNYTPPTGGSSYTALMGQCSVSGTTATVSILKMDNTAPSSVAYTYKVDKMVPGTGPTPVVSSTSGSSTSFTFTTSTSGMYDVAITVTSPSSQMVYSGCYKM
ncbi:MAG: hypothetical protein HY537_10215 [Deltaproteobacteria bacterium]|nr:hypothetical protein [Deltaproteobacteria bacterium]